MQSIPDLTDTKSKEHDPRNTHTSYLGFWCLAYFIKYNNI